MNNTTFQQGNFHIWAVLVCGAMVWNTLVAQIANPGYTDKSLFRGAAGITTGAVQQSYTLNKYGTVAQQSAPLSIAVPLANRMLLTVASSAGMSKADTSKLQGVADTRVSLSYALPGDKFWMTIGASLPTGKTKLTNSELETSIKISQTALGLRIPVFGQGLNINGGMAYASALTRRLVFGFGISYAYRGTYEPINTATISYDPGDEVSANVGIDFITYSKAARLSIDLSAAYSFEDRLNGTKTFQAGPRAILLGVYSLKTGTFTHQLTARIRYRQQNTYITDSVTTTYDAGVQGEGQYSLTYQLNEWLVASAVGEVKYYTPDQLLISGQLAESGNAAIGAVGADFLFLVSDVVSPTLGVRYARGSITIDDINYELTGVEVNLGVRISF